MIDVGAGCLLLQPACKVRDDFKNGANLSNLGLVLPEMSHTQCTVRTKYSFEDENTTHEKALDFGSFVSLLIAGFRSTQHSNSNKQDHYYLFYSLSCFNNTITCVQ